MKLFCKLLLLCGMALSAAEVTPVPEKIAELEAKQVEGSISGNALAADGKYLYLAGAKKMQIYSLQDPLNPKLVSELRIPSAYPARQMTVHRGYAYITARSAGLWIADVRNVTKPRLVGNFDTAELATGVDASANLLYITLRQYGVQIFDISNPEKPVQINRFNTDEAQSCSVNGSRIAVGEWGSKKVRLFEMDDAGLVRQLDSHSLDGYGDGVFLTGSKLYAATGHHSPTGPKLNCMGHGLEVFSVSPEGKLTLTHRVKFPKFYSLGNDFWKPVPAGKFAAVADTHNGMYWVELPDKGPAKIIGAVHMPMVTSRHTGSGKPEKIPGCVGNVVPGEGAVYIAGIGLYVLKAPGSHFAPKRAERADVQLKPVQAKMEGFRHYDCGGMVRRVKANGDFLYVAASDAGLQIYRRTADGMRKVDTVPGRWYDMDFYGDLMVAAAGRDGIVTFRIQPDGKLTKIGQYQPWSGVVQTVHLYSKGTIAGFSCGGNAAFFTDLRDPAKPGRRQSFPTRHILYNDSMPEQMIGNILPVCALSKTYWFKLADGRAEQLYIDWKNGTRMSCGIGNLGNKYLMPVQNGYYLVSPDDLGKAGYAKKLGTAETTPFGFPVWDGKDRMVSTHRRNGTVRLLDVSNPEKPKLLWEKSVLPGTPDRAVFWNGKIVIPAGFNGLFIERDNSKNPAGGFGTFSGIGQKGGFCCSR